MFVQGARALWSGGGDMEGVHLVLQVEDLLITLTPIWIYKGTWIYERLLRMSICV